MLACLCNLRRGGAQSNGALQGVMGSTGLERECGGNNEGEKMGSGTSSGRMDAYDRKAATERVQLEKLINGKPGMIVLDGIQFIKIPERELWDYVPITMDGWLDEAVVWIEYRDGKSAVYGDGDDMTKVRRTGIKNAILETDWGYAFVGKDIAADDYGKYFERDPGMMDWRLDGKRR